MPAHITDLKFQAVRGLDASGTSRVVKNLDDALQAIGRSVTIPQKQKGS
jgi:hypothetical protein